MEDQTTSLQEIERLITTFGEEDPPEAFNEDEDYVWSIGIKDIAKTTLFLIEEPAVLPLIEALSSKNLAIREWAASTLGDLEDKRMVEPLLRMIQNEQEELHLRLKALRILGAQKERQSVEALIDIFNYNKDAQIQAGIATSLGKIGDRRAVEPLIEALYKSENVKIRRSATSALAEIEDPRTFDALVVMLKDGDVQTQSSAVYGLGKLKDARAYDLILPLVSNSGLKQPAIIALGNLGDNRACQLLTDWLDTDVIYYPTIVQALCELGPECAYAPILKIFRNGSNFRAAMAASCLGKFRFPGAFNLLMSKIRKKDDYMEPYAIVALGELGDNRAFEPMVPLLTNTPERIAVSAVIALGILGDNRAFDPLVKALNSNNPKMRFSVVRALGRLKDARALPILKQIALSDFERDEDVEEESGFICDAAVNSIKELRRLTNNLKSL